jgi:hypothetical protein
VPRRIEWRVQRLGSTDDAQAGVDGARGVVFVSRRVAEVDQHAVAHVASDKALIARDEISHQLLVAQDQGAQVLGVESLCHGGRADHVAEHHRQLSALGDGGGSGNHQLSPQDCWRTGEYAVFSLPAVPTWAVSKTDLPNKFERASGGAMPPEPEPTPWLTTPGSA